jgi:hypothetical protein
MSSQVPTSPANWYPDPEGSGLRWWDGQQWTEHRHPSSPVGPVEKRVEQPGNGGILISLPLLLAAMGAALVAVAVFLPAVEVDSALHIARNSWIQHPEGAIALGVALLALLASLRGSAAIPFFGGVAIVALAVYAGVNPSHLIKLTGAGEEILSYTAGTVLGERVEEAIHPSAGPGVWAMGIGGAILALSGARTAEMSGELPSLHKVAYGLGLTRAK